MSSNTGSTKDQAAEDPSVMSPEELDRLIAEQDPEFKSRVAEIATAEAVADLNIELIDIDQLMADQEARTLKARLRLFFRKVRGFSASLKASIVHWLVEDLKGTIKKFGGSIKKFIESAQEDLRQFGFKPLKYKLRIISFLVFSILVLALLVRGITHGFVPKGGPLFIRSLADVAIEKHLYDPEKDQEVFYSSYRTAQNIFVVQRLIVNLKRSGKSGPNPMAMGEVYIEGVSPDVIVEIKDREVEFKDAFLRAMEDFSYDDLLSEQGKKDLTKNLGREADHLATQGRVRRVYLRNLVLKP